MKINQIAGIGSDKGDWLILTDYGGGDGGLMVTSQHETIEDAVRYLGEMGSRQAIVKLQEFTITMVEKNTLPHGPR